MRDPSSLVRPALKALPRYTPGRSPEAPGDGRRTFKLSSNENPAVPVDPVRRAIADALAEPNRYPDMHAGRLVHAIADVHGVDPAAIALGTGSVGVLGQVLQATCEPGDEVVMAWRSFEAYPIAAGAVGAVCVPVPLRPGARHDLPAMAEAVTERTRAVLVCTPNNPTGPAVRHDELEAALDRIAGRALVVIDEAYAEFVRDPGAARGLDLASERDDVLVLRTFSKAHGLAGLRVGYGVAHPDVASAVRAVAPPFGVSAVAQAAAFAALQAPELIAEQVEAVVAERTRVVAALARQGWEIPDAQGNFVWLALREDTQPFVAACAAVGVAVRGFAGEGVRWTIGEPEADDLVLDITADPRWEERHAG